MSQIIKIAEQTEYELFAQGVANDNGVTLSFEFKGMATPNWGDKAVRKWVVTWSNAKKGSFKTVFFNSIHDKENNKYAVEPGYYNALTCMMSELNIGSESFNEYISDFFTDSDWDDIKQNDTKRAREIKLSHKTMVRNYSEFIRVFGHDVLQVLNDAEIA